MLRRKFITFKCIHEEKKQKSRKTYILGNQKENKLKPKSAAEERMRTRAEINDVENKMLEKKKN